MTVRERILALKLLEHQARDPGQTQRLGIRVDMNWKPAAEKTT